MRAVSALGRLLDALEGELGAASRQDIEAALVEARRSREAAVREVRKVLLRVDADKAAALALRVDAGPGCGHKRRLSDRQGIE